MTSDPTDPSVKRLETYIAILIGTAAWWLSVFGLVLGVRDLGLKPLVAAALIGADLLMSLALTRLRGLREPLWTHLLNAATIYSAWQTARNIGDTRMPVLTLIGAGMFFLMLYSMSRSIYECAFLIPKMQRPGASPQPEVLERLVRKQQKAVEHALRTGYRKAGA